MKTKAKLRGVLQVPGDKSVSHRALIFSALCEGTVRISGLSPAEDCLSTARCMQKLGLQIDLKNSSMLPSVLTVLSPGLEGLHAPAEPLDAGNSGTTMRVLSGLVAGRPFVSTFDGDESLRKRPMRRVLDLLTRMGASVEYQGAEGKSPVDGCAPYRITGAHLKGGVFDLPIASAQVQTALLLAGLQADEMTKVTTPQIVRDHTERMFTHMGVPFARDNGTISVCRLSEPVPSFDIVVPADLSSAAFFMVAAACLPGSDLLLKSTGVNAGRRLIVDALKTMNADVQMESEAIVSGEPVADIRVRGSGRLQGATISGEVVATGIDEIPILALAGCFCEGQFTVTGADELRHKESDRLTAIVDNLRAAGVEVEELPDGFTIRGAERVRGGSLWKTFKDHRLAMCGLVANLLFDEPLEIEETESAKISFPSFNDFLKKLVVT